MWATTRLLSQYLRLAQLVLILLGTFTNEYCGNAFGVELSIILVSE